MGKAVLMDFARSLLLRLDRSQDAEAIVEQLLDEEGRLYPFELENHAAGRRFEQAEPEFRRAILMAMLAWHEQNAPAPYRPLKPKAARDRWKMLEAFDHMLKRKLALTEADLIALVD